LESGLPLANTEITLEQNVAVIGVRAREIYRTAKGLETLSPKRFNYDLAYRPMEDLL